MFHHLQPEARIVISIEPVKGKNLVILVPECQVIACERPLFLCVECSRMIVAQKK